MVTEGSGRGLKSGCGLLGVGLALEVWVFVVWNAGLGVASGEWVWQRDIRLCPIHCKEEAIT